MDSSKSLAANVIGILHDVVAPTGVPKGRKLGQLNNLVKIIRTVLSRNIAQSRAASATTFKSKGTSASSGAKTTTKGEEKEGWDRVFGLSPEDFVACLVVGLLSPQCEVCIRSWQWRLETVVNLMNFCLDVISFRRDYMSCRIDIVVVRSFVVPQLWKLCDGITFVILELHFWDLVQCLLIAFCF